MSVGVLGPIHKNDILNEVLEERENGVITHLFQQASENDPVEGLVPTGIQVEGLEEVFHC